MQVANNNINLIQSAYKNNKTELKTPGKEEFTTEVYNPLEGSVKSVGKCKAKIPVRLIGRIAGKVAFKLVGGFAGSALLTAAGTLYGHYVEGQSWGDAFLNSL